MAIFTNDKDDQILFSAGVRPGLHIHVIPSLTGEFYEKLSDCAALPGTRTISDPFGEI